MSNIYQDLCDWHRFDEEIRTCAQPIPLFRGALKQAGDILREHFEQQVPIEELVHERATFIDQLLTRAWTSLVERTDHDIALVAVGGYGRGELHPASDIDLLILLEEDTETQHAEVIEKFLMLMWDIGLEVGHSVRTVHDCYEQGKNDITVATNLMEARLIYGSQSLFEAMQAQVGPDLIWPGREFFQAKLEEQAARHHRFGDTAYNLEPNIKENPGGN
jgi:[protein-PII] uridylyltransferase